MIPPTLGKPTPTNPPPTPSPTATSVDPCYDPLDKLVVVSGTLSPGASQGCVFFLWHETARITILVAPPAAEPVLLEVYDQSRPAAPVAKIDEPATILDGSHLLSRLYWHGSQEGLSYEVNEWVCNAVTH